MAVQNRRFTLLAAASAATLGVAAVVTAMPAMTAQAAAAGCRVTYTVTNQWNNGFGASVDVTNLGDPLTSWTAAWSFAAGQT